MGGRGSGRRRGEGTRLTTDELPALDVRVLKRRGLISPQSPGLILRDDQVAGGEVRLPLVWTPCIFAGERPWFVCPGEGCGRRAAILYLDGSGHLLCRLCLDLAYPSQYAGRKKRKKNKEKVS